MAFEKPIRINPFLAPISFLYEIGVRFRNQLFDWGVLTSQQYSIPIICIGNLSAGGTGKTPHTEFLIQFLSEKYRVAVISRGYKRKSSGYILATQQSTSYDIGDEPFQIKKKFPKIIVAVDANRTRAINNLIEMPETERAEVILLDDAFQHRYVTPSFSILLTDYNRRFYFDRLLPSGRLREPKCGCRRANVLIITKCNPDLKPIGYRVLESEAELLAYQKLFFTGIKYGKMIPVFANNKSEPRMLTEINNNEEILLVSGIASPLLFIEEVKKHTSKITVLSFSDHHMFKKGDLKKIKDTFNKLASVEKLILVTEKDAARLLDNKDIPEELKEKLYYLPIEIDFRLNKEEIFKNIIIDHVDSFKRNRILT